MEPTTEIGKRLVEIAEAHAEDFATRADRHDRENSFPFENFEAMRTSGYMAATVPEELGGMGLTSSYDFALGTNRIARGCGATALASNMARGVILSVANQWRALQASGNPAASRIEATLRGVVEGTVGFCGANSEPGTTVMFMQTTATKTDDGWVLNGRKIFATAAPAATSIGMMARYDDPEKGPRLLLARVPAGSPGMTINEDWDAMGMRGTGSPSITLEDCKIPAALVVDVGPYGVWSQDSPLFGFLGGNNGVGQAAAFLGVAESAQDYILEHVVHRKQRPGGKTMNERSAVQQLVAENEIDLSASAAYLEHVGRQLENQDRSRLTDDALHEVVKLNQSSRIFVTQAAVRVVDRAMTIAGGAGYMSSSPLSRMYRDVRAGPVMPMTPIDAYEYIGKVTLGLEPDIW
jgi:L-evernosamine nitrososynthase